MINCLSHPETNISYGHEYLSNVSAMKCKEPVIGTQGSVHTFYQKK